MFELQIGETVVVDGVEIRLTAITNRNVNGVQTQVVSLETVKDRVDPKVPEVQVNEPTFESIGLPKRVSNKLIAASADNPALASPKLLKAWIAEGNDLSNAVDGIGDSTEQTIMKALESI
jgi:hypothetical protein